MCVSVNVALLNDKMKDHIRVLNFCKFIHDCLLFWTVAAYNTYILFIGVGTRCYMNVKIILLSLVGFAWFRESETGNCDVC